MSELLSRLKDDGPALAEQVLATMYANPFWSERFGERGRRRASEDGAFHLAYLTQALSAKDPEVLVQYARWLQVVLTARGMCSRHLADNFRLLAEALAKAAWPGVEEAVRYLHEAEAALRYPEGPARTLQDRSGELSRQVAQALYARHPKWLSRWGEAGRARCKDDVRYHLSYLADAVATGRAELFTAYVTWIAAFLERRFQLPPSHLVETLTELERSVAQLGAPELEGARAYLGAGRAALSPPVSEA